MRPSNQPRVSRQGALVLRGNVLHVDCIPSCDAWFSHCVSLSFSSRHTLTRLKLSTFLRHAVPSRAVLCCTTYAIRHLTEFNGLDLEMSITDHYNEVIVVLHNTFKVPHRTAPHRTAPYRTAPHRTVPYRTVPCHTLPRHTVPCHTVLCHTVPCRTVLCHTVPCHTVPYHTVPHHTVPHHTVPHHTVPYHTVPCHTVPRHTVP